MAIQRVSQPIGRQLAPGLGNAELDAGIERLAAFLETLVKLVAIGIELLEAIARHDIELVVVVVHDVNAARGAAGEEVLAFVQVQRDEVEVTMVVVVGCEVRILAEAQAAAEAGAASRLVPERNLGNFLRLRQRDCQKQTKNGPERGRSL